MPVSEMLSRKRFADDSLALSPDGNWVAYTLHDNRTRVPLGDADFYKQTVSGNLAQYVDADVWLTNTTTGDTRNLTGGLGASWAPAWSPDGTQLAFYSDRDGRLRLWMWSRRTGELRRASGVVVQSYPYLAPLWTPDGRRVLIPLRTDTTHASRVQDRDSVRVFWSATSRTKVSSDTVKSPLPSSVLVLLDVSTGAVTPLLGSGHDVVRWWLSPDGGTLALQTIKGMMPATPGSRPASFGDLLTLNLATQERTIVASRLHVYRLSFSPDSRSLAFVPLPTASNVRRDCFVAAVGGPARPVMPGSHESFVADEMAPLWGPDNRTIYLYGTTTLWAIRLGRDGRAMMVRVAATPRGQEIVRLVARVDGAGFWSPDGGRSLLMITRDTLSQAADFVLVNVRSGTSVARYSANQFVGDPSHGRTRIIGSASAHRVVFVAESMDHPPDLWMAGGDLRQPRQLTHLNLRLEQYARAATRLIEWRDSSGAVRRGLLLLPTAFVAGHRYPMVVQQYPSVYGSRLANRFGGEDAADLLNLHLLTSRGYAVLLPDVPGGPDTLIMRLTWSVIANGVARAVELGVADSTRLAIMGHSFGGYAVLGTLVSTPRFRTGVALSGGYFNYAAQFAQMQRDGTALYTKTSLYMLNCALWTCPTRYGVNSPLFFLERVTTPLLLVDGERDESARPEQSEQVFVGLRLLGREVEYALYPGEGHDYAQWSRAHQEDVVNRILTWFDRYLKGPNDTGRTD